MNSRIINQTELDVIFYEELTQQQVSHVFKIITILAQYVLLDTNMLVRIYREQYKDNMGLSYLKRAVKEKLIIEYQEDYEESSEQKLYYYALKSSTLIYLQQNRIPYLRMPFCAGHEEKSRLLTYNSYAMQRDMLLNLQQPLDIFLRYFITVQNVICYFPNCISKSEIQVELQNRKLEIDYRYESVSIPLLRVGKHTRARHPRDVD